MWTTQHPYLTVNPRLPVLPRRPPGEKTRVGWRVPFPSESGGAIPLASKDAPEREAPKRDETIAGGVRNPLPLAKPREQNPKSRDLSGNGYAQARTAMWWT